MVAGTLVVCSTVSSASWATVLSVLEPRREPTRVDLTVSYRTPQEVLDFAAPTLRAAAPDIAPPRPVRRAGSEPIVELVDAASLDEALVRATTREIAAVAPGRVAVIAQGTRVAEILDTLRRHGLDAVDPREEDSRGLSADLVVLAAEAANGLEFDAVVVVEPGQIASRGASVAGEPTAAGLRPLYVAVTRPTPRPAVGAQGPLPRNFT